MGIFHGCMGFSSLSRITSGYWCFSRNWPVLSIEVFKFSQASNDPCVPQVSISVGCFVCNHLSRPHGPHGRLSSCSISLRFFYFKE